MNLKKKKKAVTFIKASLHPGPTGSRNFIQNGIIRSYWFLLHLKGQAQLGIFPKNSVLKINDCIPISFKTPGTRVGAYTWNSLSESKGALPDNREKSHTSHSPSATHTDV